MSKFHGVCFLTKSRITKNELYLNQLSKWQSWIENVKIVVYVVKQIP